jgi:hypothetical protein
MTPIIQLQLKLRKSVQNSQLLQNAVLPLVINQVLTLAQRMHLFRPTECISEGRIT